MERAEIEDRPIDYVTTAAKGALGAVPLVGSLLAELAGNVIPNQRIDRITKFAVLLESRLGLLQERLAVDSKTKLLKIDSQGRTEVKGYTLSSLGRLMLRSIGLPDDMG